jgi:hypothetical protein
MGSKADRKPKEQSKPKESFLSPEQRKLKMREEIRKAFQIAFAYEDSAKIPNQRSK